MRNRTGMNTSVVFGFVKFLRDILKRERPDLLGVAFDPKGGSFRRTIFPEYKANRAETPEDILISVPYVKRVLEAMCIPILEVEGYEADDVIGTLSQKGAAAGYDDTWSRPTRTTANWYVNIAKSTSSRGTTAASKSSTATPSAKIRYRRPCTGARYPRLMGRYVGQHPGRAGHRREKRLQVGAGVGHGGEYPR